MNQWMTDKRLHELLRTVSKVGDQEIPPNTPCFWDEKDQVAATYTDIRELILELLERRKRDRS